ncbi:hypothetical protein V8B97DRAFT_1913559 [Scleroderma yunnanense]
MVRTVTKVVYKPDSQSTDEFIAIINPAEFKRWKNGDTSIPLAEVVDSRALSSHPEFISPHSLTAFDVFFSNQGAQGILGRPSRQQLENVFGTSKDVDVIMTVLQKGKEQPGNGFTTGVVGTNIARTNAVIDNKGKGLSGI